MMIRLFILGGICWLLVACDCQREVEGSVLDKESGAPLSGVQIHEVPQELYRYPTDSVGHFQFQDISGGFRCPDVVLIFRKEGYEAVTRTFPSSARGVVVFLKKDQKGTAEE